MYQLREHCKPRLPAFDAGGYSHYLDLVSYWQDQCQKAQEECSRMRSINIRLERSNQQLSQQTNTTQDVRQSTASSVSKRKAAVSPTRSPKRQKPPAEQTVAQTQEAIEEDYVFLDGLGIGKLTPSLRWRPSLSIVDGVVLVDALYSTHQLCRATERDAQALCHHLIKTSSALSKVIHIVAYNHEHHLRRGIRVPGAQSLDQDRSEFAQALTVSARVFMSILVGITKMMDVSHDDGLPSLIICELAETFKTVLCAIESSARHTADTSLCATISPKKGKAKEPVAMVKESVPARSLAHFLIGLLGLLDKTNAVHQRLFDAFAFLLLERVGKHLYYCTFGRHRGATIEDDLSPSIEPSDSTSRNIQDIEGLGVRLELKALVLILDRAMGLAPHHMNPPSNRAAKSPYSDRLIRTLSMKTLPAAPKGRLSSLAKDRLQRTLVHCMYGHKVDDEFLDILTKPVPSMRLGNLQSMAKSDEKDVEQWYKEEVWRLVGWDIMARESGW